MKQMQRLLWPALALSGWFGPNFLSGGDLVASTLTVVAIFAVMSYGLDIVLSDLGEVSLAHSVFFAAGAYATALLSTEAEWSAWATLPAACVTALVLALVLGLLTLRMREFVFSLVTYAASVVCMTIAANWSFLGGSDGIVGIPPIDLSIGPIRLAPGGNRDFYHYAYALLLVVLWFVARFRRSRLGQRALMGQMNPLLATSSGIDCQQTRLMVFLISAPITALGGWLYAYQRAYVGADLFETYFLVLMLTAVVVPGRRVLLGPLFGIAALEMQSSLFSFGAYLDKIVMGSLLALTLCIFPDGLTGIWRRVRGGEDA